MLMTPIYMNVLKQVGGSFEIISVNFRGGSAGYSTDYVFSHRFKDYRLLVN